MYLHDKFQGHRSKNDWVMVVLGFKCFFYIFVLENWKIKKKILKATLELGNVHSWQISSLQVKKLTE